MTMKRLCATALTIAWALCALAAEKSGTIVYINGSKYYIHTVQAGETLYSLAREYGVGEQVIVENNPSVAQGLKADARLKIPFMAEAPEAKPSERKLKKTFDMHYVRKGETLYAISRRYAISIQTILEDNPNLDPTHLRPDERILIRRKESGKGSEAQRQAEWEAYRTALNSVAEKGYAYHIVRPGETFYSLSRRFGTTEEELSRLNNGLQPADLKAGAMLKIPSDEPAAPAPAVDSLSVAHPDSAAARQLPEVTFRALRRSEPLDVALMLPISVKGRANSNYLEFYQGFLLGLEQVKQRYGYSVELTFYNTGRDSAAIDRIVGGLEKPNMPMTPEERRITAIHEAGHAVVMWSLPECDPVLKVTVVPRGRSLGATWSSPDEDRIHVTDEALEEQLAGLLGGRIAEEVNYHTLGVGALSDLERATKTAYAMVTYYGMSKKIGPLSYYDSTGTRDTFTKPFSEQTAHDIDVEVRRFVEEAYARARAIIEAKNAQINAIADLLLEKETIYSEDLEQILGPAAQQPRNTAAKGGDAAKGDAADARPADGTAAASDTEQADASDAKNGAPAASGATEPDEPKRENTPEPTSEH